MMNELSVDAAEEIELLIKWLGPISSTYARSIKISNVWRDWMIDMDVQG